MRNRILTATLVLTGAAIAAAATLPLPITAPAAQDPMMESPTDHHKIVMRGVGHWKGEMTVHSPMGEMKMAGEEHTTAVGGFWTKTTFSADMMGTPYTGAGWTGYSAEKKKYVGTWIDSMSSHASIMEGEYDEETNTLTMRWTAPDSTGTGKMVPHRYETVIRDDSYTMTFYEGEGDGTKTAVSEMKRVKDSDK